MSLNVLKPGEVAATAGTSGVIYAVTDQLFSDKYSRVNAFAHVNHTAMDRRLGVLLCINGTGIMNSWIKKMCGDGLSYKEMDAMCSSISPGSDGCLFCLLEMAQSACCKTKWWALILSNIDLNKHTKAHIFRAVQEGIAFAFRYGLDIMRENNLHPTIIRAGKSNLFLSDVFIQSFVNATGVPVELYSNDGSVGAALGAGIGAGIYKNFDEAFSQFKPLKKVEPTNTKLYDELYAELEKAIRNSSCKIN